MDPLAQFPKDPASKQRHALLLLHSALSLESLKVHWEHVWRAYDGSPPVAALRAKNARKAQIELSMGMK